MCKIQPMENKYRYIRNNKIHFEREVNLGCFSNLLYSFAWTG